jgi:DNA polymerase-3 subunit epsilon
LRELEQQKFISNLSDDHKKSAIGFLTKMQLYKWLRHYDLEVKPSLAKDALAKKAFENLEILHVTDIPDFQELIVQKRFDTLEYLLFLYFGKIQSGMNLYTLRDLGIRRANETKEFSRPRFTVKAEAQADYFFAKAVYEIDRIENKDDIRLLFTRSENFKNLKTSAKKLKNELYLNLAEKAEEYDVQLALEILSACKTHPARAKQVRISYKLELKDECRRLLDEIVQDPYCDEELLFAEDFINRKFDKKRIGYLTQILNNSHEISLSDSYFKKPERGVQDLYRSQGHQAYFTENFLWTGLFGIFFWDELFEKENSALFNQFERSPADLIGEDFYNNHQDAIEQKLQFFRDPKKAELHVLKMLSLHHGKLNDIFHWQPELIKMMIDFIRVSQNQNVAHILRTMAKRFESYHSGFPDLMIIENGTARFIEVKAEGDQIRAQQLSKARLLTEAGFHVEILKVRWEVDPNQVYVVVDLETTGGSSQFHRVTEIGAVKIKNGQVIEEFQTLINPGRSIPKFITDITGITNEMVQDAPKFSEIAEKFNEFTQGAIFVAHNVKFDYGFIQKEFAKLEQDYVRPHMCTVQGMRKAFPGLASYSLKNLTQYFQISLETHHRALCDAKAATELLLLMQGKKSQASLNLSCV